MKLKTLLFALLLPVTAWGQGVRFDASVLTSATNVPPGAQAPLYTYPNSVVTVCAYPASSTIATCTNKVTIYSNVTLTTTMGNPITSDSQGKFGFWLGVGNYSYSITSPTGKFLGSYIFSLGGAGGAGTGTVTSISGVNANGLTWTITNPTTTPSLTAGPDNTHCIPTNTGAAGTFLSHDCTYQTPPNTTGLTSVGVTMPSSTFSVTNNPLTSNGLIGIGLATQSPGLVFAAPSASTGVPTFRGLIGTDLPQATNTTFGAIKPDNTSCTVTSGVLTCPGSGGISLTTTGLGGAATLISSVLNIPRYDTGINGTAFCTGFTPTNGQFIELTTGGSPNPCYTATAGGGSGPNNFPGTTHQFVTSYSSGTLNFASAQPSFTDISGTMAPAQCPLGSSAAFGCVKVDGTSITVASGVISAISAPAPCPAATCILVAPSANQTITQPTGTNLGSSHSNWGISPVTGLSDAVSTSGTFSTYTGDTGGSSVSGGVNMRTDQVNFTDPGWNLGAGFAYQPGSPWQVSTGHFVVTNSNSAGIKNGIYSPLVCNGEGDCNGISNSTVYHGNQTEGAGEGNTGIENQMVEGGGTSATVVTGGSKATTIVLSGGNGIGIGRLAIDTTSGGTSTTQTLGSTFGNFQIVNLGTSVPVSTCGTVAGGALIGTTQYSIASNILTVFASNSFFPSEQLTLSGYTTSSFLNGTYIIFNANSTSFQINFTHANVSLTTEAGFVNTTNVDTPRVAGAGSTAMTFGVTLGSAYSLPSPAPIATYAGPGWSDSERLVSVGSYTGGVQYLTMNLFKPISNGANFCIGGLAGYVEKNTTTGGEFYNYILGSPTSTSAYVYAMRQGSPSRQFVYAGNISMYPAATVRSFVPGTNTVTLTDNNMASAASDNYSIPDGIVASYSFQNNNLLNLNPNAVLLGSQYRYTGSPLIFGGQMLDVYPGTPGNLISQGGTGHAPVGMLFEAVVGAGLQFRNPPSDCADGNSCNNALMNVDCEVATVTCAPTYDIWHDGDGTSRDSELLFTRASNLINFRAAAGPSAVLQVNGHQVCDSSGAGGGSCGGGSGTVTSVGLTTPSWLTVAGSPVTTSGTLAVTPTGGLTANQFLGTPNGTTGALSPRAIVAADIPTLNQNTTGTAAGLTSYPTICSGGQFSQGLSSGSNNCGTPSGSGTVFQQNGVGLSSSSTVNFQSGSAIVVSNPSAGNVAFNLSIVPLTLGGLAASTTPSAAQLLVANAGATAYAPVSMSQDCTITSLGVITCTKTNNVAFAPSATTDTTNATNVSSGTLAAARLPAQYTKGSCTEAWGGSGTSHALSSGDDAVVNNTCYNDSGVTRTITAVKCRNDNASNTTTVNPTFGSAGTGTTILSSALTCGNSYAYSSSGTVSNASWTTGTGIDPVQGGTLTGTSVAVIVEYTF